MEMVGVEVKSPLQPNTFMSKVILLAETCDFPAKCYAMHLMGNMAVPSAFSLVVLFL